MQDVILKLQELWFSNKERYLKAEKGSQGNEGFTTEFLKQVFGLSENNDGKHKIGTYKNQLVTGEGNRTADFVLYPSQGVIIPLEVEKLGNTKAGAKQLLNYQLDFDTNYGILTDGKIWRFFTSTTRFTEFDLENDIFEDFERFWTFWTEYINAQTFYSNYFNGKLFEDLFEESIKPKVNDNREKYFKRTTKLVSDFRNKLISKGFIANELFDEHKQAFDESKKATELAYSYLIQFILYKTLVDSKYFDKEYNSYMERIKTSLENKDYTSIIKIIRQITDAVGNKIYQPFFKDQEDINQALSKIIFSLENPEIEDVSLFLDILIYIDSFDFSGLGGDIFGYIYENYLKELYSDENKGQFFTDPHIAVLMLEEMGWTVENLTEKIKAKEFDKLSLIDPACGSGTFLYSATRTLIKAGQKANIDPHKIIDLVIENIVGFDVEEFPLYLAEMNILMRLLPLIYSDSTNPKPVEKRLKIFWTEDSLSEFRDVYKANAEYLSQIEHKQDSIFTSNISQQKRFMRDEKQLETLKKEILETKRKKFDYVIANPPYIGYNECSKVGVKFIKKKLIQMSDVYGVNLNTAPNKIKKYSPKPNLYAFFLALSNGLLKLGGTMCYIIPQTLLTATDLDVVRYWLSNNMDLKKLVTFQNNLFVLRGVKQTKKIATSSLIVIAQKV